MTDLLDAADAPVIVDVCGPGADAATICWHDLGFEHGYQGVAAQMHGGLLSDLLGRVRRRERALVAALRASGGPVEAAP